ncbi:MAG: GNAT family N-acetyltransferase [Chromatiales bacterium]|nr:MAG: GNAT family N-acetyltransferase [Chromatiales bacterium]
MPYLVPAELQTPRLLLRQFLDDDWQDLHDYYSDQDATRYTFGRLLTEGDTWRIMCGMIGHWQIRGYGPYAVEEKETGKVLGTVGFWYPIDWPEPEIKWALARKHWGQGFASEAARAVQAAGKQYLPDISLISLIHPDNLPSIRLARSIGAEFEREAPYEGKVFHVYRHPVTS